MAKKRNLSKAARDNRSRQLDSEHSTYWKSRGYSDRPKPNPNKKESA